MNDFHSLDGLTLAEAVEQRFRSLVPESIKAWKRMLKRYYSDGVEDWPTPQQAIRRTHEWEWHRINADPTVSSRVNGQIREHGEIEPLLLPLIDELPKVVLQAADVIFDALSNGKIKASGYLEPEYENSFSSETIKQGLFEVRRFFLDKRDSRLVYVDVDGLGLGPKFRIVRLSCNEPVASPKESASDKPRRRGRPRVFEWDEAFEAYARKLMTEPDATILGVSKTIAESYFPSSPGPEPETVRRHLTKLFKRNGVI